MDIGLKKKVEIKRFSSYYGYCYYDYKSNFKRPFHVDNFDRLSFIKCLRKIKALSEPNDAC